MGRTYMVDGSLQSTLNRIVESGGNDWSVGLVIGQFSTQRDYVVHLAATPKFEPPSSVETTEEATPTTSAVTSMKSSESRNSLCLGKTLDTLNEKQVTNHARQAQRMLTGGLDILGIFVIAQPDDIKNAQQKLRQVVYSVHKFLSKSESRLNTTCHNDRILLHYCPITKKYTCRTFDVSDGKSTGNPGEWKILKSPESFTELSAKSYALDLVIPVQAESLSFSLQKQVISGLSPLFDSVQDSLAVYNGRLVTEEALPMGGGSEQGKSKNKKQDGSSGDRIRLDLLTSTYSNDSLSKPTPLVCGAKLVVKGTIATKAFVHNRVTMGEAVKALKGDIIRSITSRCELLCEDLLSAEEDQDASVVYETPTRVFVSLPGVPSVQFCDYLFQDETAGNSAERFRELLGIDVSEEDIDCSKEHIPDENDLNFPELQLTKTSDYSTTGSVGHVSSQKPVSVSVYYLMALFAAILAVLLTYHFISQT